MNLLGKIFVVLIFVMSLVFMAFVMAVYATHTNWKNSATALKTKLDSAQQRNQQLKEELTKLEGDVAAQEQARQAALAKLENQNTDLQRERDRLERERADLQKDQREAVAAMQATQASLASLRQEVQTLRTNIQTAQQDRREAFNRLVKLTDEMHQVANELTSLKSRNVQLSQQLADATQVLRKFSLEPVPAKYEGVPPQATGRISALTGSGLVEIDIGADEGLQKGHRLEVYRIGADQSKYLGRIELIEVQPDKAVAKILPEFQKGAIQVGDRVASKIE